MEQLSETPAAVILLPKWSKTSYQYKNLSYNYCTSKFSCAINMQHKQNQEIFPPPKESTPTKSLINQHCFLNTEKQSIKVYALKCPKQFKIQ